MTHIQSLFRKSPLYEVEDDPKKRKKMEQAARAKQLEQLATSSIQDNMTRISQSKVDYDS
jgi:hypothetical protein